MEPAKTLEWMYTPSALVNREDYLLGRAVDKTFSILESVEQTGEFSYADEVEKDLTPISIFAPPTRAGPVDVIKKIKEDPLYQIQKKEEENLKKLLKNPVRMKQMRQVSEQLEKQRRLSESTSVKSKHKKHRKRDSSSSSSSSTEGEDNDKLNLNNVKSFKDIDKLISEKLKSLKKQAQDDSSSEEETTKHSSKSHRHHDRYRDLGSSRHDRDNRKREKPHHYRSDRRRTRSRSRSRDRDRKPVGTTSSSSRSVRPPPTPKPKRAALDEGELEKRRQEMMHNATWRDEQRTKNVTKYREEEKKEVEQQNSKHDTEFIRKQLIEAANTGSVEQRIKSNSYNIQKSYSAMSQNFAKR